VVNWFYVLIVALGEAAVMAAAAGAFFGLVWVTRGLKEPAGGWVRHLGRLGVVLVALFVMRPLLVLVCHGAGLTERVEWFLTPLEIFIVGLWGYMVYLLLQDYGEQTRWRYVWLVAGVLGAAGLALVLTSNYGQTVAVTVLLFTALVILNRVVADAAWSRYVLLGLFAAASLILPWVVSEFWIREVNLILILGLFAVSFNLVFGYMGQLSFGHAAFFGVGAYTTGLLIVKLKPFWMAALAASPFLQLLLLIVYLLAAMLLAAVVAFILGYFCVRLTGIYFAILTMAFGQLIFYIIFQWYDFTGGDNGLLGVGPPALVAGKVGYYYFTWATVVVALVVMWLITESPFGYTMRAIRDNADRTRFIGINTRWYMLINFTVAGAFAGLAGALYGPFNLSVSPDLCNWEQSGVPVFMTLIGGAGGFLGPMAGAVVFQYLHARVTEFTVYWPLTIGLIIMFVVLFMPGGVKGLADRVKDIVGKANLADEAGERREAA
jgi:branched-chain amino acid transport system permease protein